MTAQSQPQDLQPLPGSFISRQSADSRARQVFRRLLPCFDWRRQFLEEEEDAMGHGGFGSFRSCDGGGSYVTAAGLSPASDFHYALNSIRRGLQILEGMDSLSLEGDIALVQVKEGLRRLEGASFAGAAPPARSARGPSSGGPGGAVQPSSPASAETPSSKTPGSLRWQDAVSAVMVQQAVSTHDGAMALALNALVTVLWPRINTYVEKMVHDDIEPMINSSLPSMFQGSVKFTKVNLGTSSPSFGPLHVDHRPESGEIEVNLGIKFASDLDMELTAVGVPVGITKISLEGSLVCLLSPPMAKPPFFGGIQVFFPNPPEVGINFVGAARVANIPGLRGAVRGAVASGIAGVCVLPRRIAVDLDEEDSVDIVDLTYPEPTAVLRVSLLSGSDLHASDVNLFGAATSDPYVTATLGCKTWTSPTVRKTLSPVWGEEGKGVVVDFPVHSERQALALKVFDYDFGSSDDLIGVAQPIGVSRFAGSSGGEALRHEIDLSHGSGEPGAGRLCFLSELLSLTSDRAKARMLGPSVAHLSVKVLRATGLGTSVEYPFTLRVRALGAEEAREAVAADGAPSGGASRSRSLFSLPNPKVSSGDSSRPAFRSGKTMQLGRSQRREVLAEAATAASTPHPEQSLAEALQSACAALAERGDSAQEIAGVLGVEAQQVQAFLASRGDPAEAERVAREAAAQRAAARPSFGEVVQVLLPAVEDHGALELALLDKRQRAVGTVELPMQRLLATEGLHLEGPFELAAAGGASGSGGGPVLEGSISLKWLA